MQGIAGTPAAVLLVGGIALLYYAIYSPKGVLAKNPINAVPSGVSGVTITPPGGTDGTGASTGNKAADKALIRNRRLSGLAPFSPEIASNDSYERQRQAFMAALASVEGGYNSVNQSSGASGKYQFMPKVWISWSKQYLGYVAEQTPANQEIVARMRIDTYYRKYSAGIASGNVKNDISVWTRIAAAWRGGSSVGKTDWRLWSTGSYTYGSNVALRMTRVLKEGTTSYHG